MSLYQKHRPSKFEDLKGNTKTRQILDSMLKNMKTCPHVFLFTGPTGCGKTTIGRIIVKRLGVSGDDFQEVNTADFRGIDSIRIIRDHSGYAAMSGKYRVWLIDECHKLTRDAQNALLKLLEDPPAHIYFILCTSEPDGLILQVKGRCSIFNMELLKDEDMMSLLKEVSKKEKDKVDKKVLKQIVSDSFGHVRNALQVLEQVLQVDPKERLIVASIQADKKAASIELIKILMGPDKRNWGKVKIILKGLKGEDPESIRRQALGYCSAVLLSRVNNNCALIMEEFSDPFYNTGFPGLVLACYTLSQT